MCGIVGVIGNHQVKQQIFDGLTMLQHRGQDAAGILTCDGYRINIHKNKGLLVNAIRTSHMKNLNGNIGIGHVRYPTSGSNDINETQPFYVNSPYGIGLAHNGNLVNTQKIYNDLLEKDFRHINTESDSELLLNVLAAEIQRIHVSLQKFSVEIYFEAVRKLYERCSGGFAVVGVIAGVGMFAFRDKDGIRPLVLGCKNIDGEKEYMIASETVALNCGGYDVIGDIAPGEAVFIDNDLNISRKICATNCTLTPCIFEYVYLARPDSVINDISVYSARLTMGEKMAHKILEQSPDHDIDVVIPVPDSGRHAALPIATILNCDYREGFVKNRYIGRTFIASGQKERQNLIRKKLNTINHEFAGKHVLLVDDSIVRGNTSRLIVNMAREAGARKVSLVSAAPIVKHPNFYGIDMPTHSELIGYGRTISEIADWIGVDFLYYQNLEDLIESIQAHGSHIKQFESSVFNGEYIA